MKYVKVAQTNELNAGEKKKISLEGKEILMTHTTASLSSPPIHQIYN